MRRVEGAYTCIRAHSYTQAEVPAGEEGGAVAEDRDKEEDEDEEVEAEEEEMSELEKLLAMEVQAEAEAEEAAFAAGDRAWVGDIWAPRAAESGDFFDDEAVYMKRFDREWGEQKALFGDGVLTCIHAHTYAYIDTSHMWQVSRRPSLATGCSRGRTRCPTCSLSCGTVTT